MHGRPHLSTGRQRHQPGARPARRVRREPPAAHPDRAGRAGGACRSRPRTGSCPSSSSGAPWPRRPTAGTSSAAGSGTSACSPPCRPGCGSSRRPTSTTSTARRWPRSHLAVRDDLEVLYVDRLAGHASVPVVSQIGSRLPIHATGVGKVLLAHAPPDIQGRVLGATLARLTPYTITQPGSLRRQLARVVRDDYATTVEEMTLGACSVAVPIRRGETVVAALGIVLPKLGNERPRLVAALQVAARGHRQVVERSFRPVEAGVRQEGTSPRQTDGHAHRGGDRGGRSGRAAARPSPRRRRRRVRGRGEPLRGVRRRADPRRHPRAVHGRPAPRVRAGGPAGARGRRAPRHLPPVARPWTGRAPPRRLRRADRPLGLGLRPDRGAEGPGRRGARPRAGDPLRGERHRAARPRDRPAVGDVHRLLGCGPAAGGRRRGRLRRLLRAVPQRGARVAAAYLGEGLPLLVARRAGRRRAVDRRADLRLAPGRLRDALDALGDGLAALPPGAQRHPDRRVVRRPDLGRAGHPARPRPGRLDPHAGADHREVGPPDALVRPDADAPRPAVPGRRRGAHRAAHRRQGAQPRGGRRRPARAGARVPAAQGRRRRSRRRTPTPRCAGSGAAPTSRGG